MLHIKELRKQHKITMKQLGEVIGVAESTISLYESGKRQADYDTLKKIADFFNVTVDSLLGHSPIQNQNILNEQLSDAEFALYGEAKDLTDEEKQKVLDFIKFTKSQRQNNK